MDDDKTGEDTPRITVTDKTFSFFFCHLSSL